MKTKNFKSLLILSTLFVSACANVPTEYVPETYREDLAFEQNFSGRTPSNIFGDCFDGIANFFRDESEVIPKPNVAGGVHLKPTAGVKQITEEMATATIRYPKGFEGKIGSHIQYGFETEYLHEETEPLLKNFMPNSEVYKGTKESWLALTREERLKFIDENSKLIFPYREKGKLIKITEEGELNEALPESFVYDAGHFELVLDPMDSADELVNKIKTINKNFGVGSMQVTVSNPLNKELLKQDSGYREEMKSEIIGYYNFINDFDTLNKLEQGYERFQVTPNALTAKSFNHPWLGPMTKLKHDKLEGLVNGIIDQKAYSEQELKEISYHVVSHKFIGGLSFRPDVAFKKGRIASEVRDCHQNVNCIENRIIRETYFLMKGKEAFVPFRALKPFDSIANFDKGLSSGSQSFLMKIFPIYGKYSPKELELYRNFSYPFRDWSKHVELLGVPGLNKQIREAQAIYTNQLKYIGTQFERQEITKEEAQAKVMGALGEFAKMSGLVDAMKAQYQHLVDPNEIKNFDKLKFSLFINHWIEHFIAA